MAEAGPKASVSVELVFTTSLSGVSTGTSCCLETQHFGTASKVAECSEFFNWL